MGSVARVFVTDIDGTLLGADGDVHPSDAEAIAALIQRGVPVTLCTGRMYSGTREIAAAMRILGPVACIDVGERRAVQLDVIRRIDDVTGCFTTRVAANTSTT